MIHSTFSFDRFHTDFARFRTLITVQFDFDITDIGMKCDGHLQSKRERRIMQELMMIYSNANEGES